MPFDRRHFLSLAAVGLGGVFAGPGRSQLAALTDAVRIGDRLGPLGPADEHGVRLPAGFSATLIGRTGEFVPGTDFRWHLAPDGGACFLQPNGPGHIYVSNSEVIDGQGGASAIDFDEAGRVRAARTILAGTSMNCSGGATPWQTWLSCEEVHEVGQVWETDPLGGPAEVRPAMGAFRHEAVAVDGRRRQVFLTEDRSDGRLYRFVPDRWPDLATGLLQAAGVVDGGVSWVTVSADAPDRSAGTTEFNGGEGAVIVGDSLMFATKGDRRIWELGLDDGRLDVFHDCHARSDTPLTHVDNLAVHPLTGDLFVAEDGGDMDLCVLVPTSDGSVVSRMVQFEGHADSEVAGPAFSPDGRFLYVSSQRGTDGNGMTFQIGGPFAEWVFSIDGGATARRGAHRLGNRQTIDP